jgi:hypothetical protein
MRYALFSNASGAVLNIIMLDDPAHYTPPVGTSIRPDADSRVGYTAAGA